LYLSRRRRSDRTFCKRRDDGYITAMPVPDYQSLMIHTLSASADGEVRIGDAVERLADQLGLTPDERAELLPSGKQTLFANRVHWAKTYLGKAGLIELTRRGYFRITDRGRQVLASHPPRIDNSFLNQFVEFRQFKERSSPPVFFERLIISLLLTMGYGGSETDAGRALGRSGDDGVDGVIDQDALGLDRVYIQAKRYAEGNNIGAGAIRDFFGSLDRHKAAKGLFVTTSSFSSSARETAEFLSKRIVLIDGQQLATLMIRHDVGCRVEDVLHIKKIDEDFFE